ncbi:translation initiation factor IF-2 subunit beta [archaeon]|nr:translation initiation factor IF-2 subunit beta [archaeon]
MDYEKMLKRAKESLPQLASASERFELPKVKGHVEGNKTIISNFAEIAGILRREKEHLLKYLQRELASPALIDGPRLVLGRRLSSALINAKISQYANDFVLCLECKRPDTQLLKEGIVLMKKCAACGAKHPIKSKI